jgi:uncharacterized protein YrrD
MGQADGRPAGHVADLLFNARGDRVIGLLLTGGTWWRRRLIPYEEVAAIGAAAVMLRRPVVLAGAEGRVRRLRRQHAAILGLRVLTADGRDLGIVDDVVFDPTTGRVEGYLVSAGLVADALYGQGFLPAEAVSSRAAGAGGPYLLLPPVP